MKRLTEQEYIDGINSGKISFTDILPEFQTEQICLAAVRLDYYYLYYVKNQTEEICLTAMGAGIHAFDYVRNQTENICIMAVSHLGTFLPKVKNQTDRICLAAVKSWGLALRFVENQTEEICLAAIQNDHGAFKYVKNQTPKIYKQAIKLDIDNFFYIDANTYEYDHLEIKDIFKSLVFTHGASFYSPEFFNKLSEILNKLPNDNLVKSVTSDLKEMFDAKYLEQSENLNSIKLKVDMLSLTKDSIDIKVKIKKPKII